MTNLALSEDDIIKKRLLIEGDSGNEDRLINKLIKNFVKWSNKVLNHESSNKMAGQENIPSQGIDDESVEYLNEQTVASLSHAEFGLFRNQFIFDMNKMEQENYEELYKRINSEIERAQKKITESKVDLIEARKIRKNRQEYDIIARKILQFPNRIEMQANIKNLEEKVEQLKRSESEYDRKIDLRRKQFSVVLQSLSSLKMLIETDSKLEMDYINDPTGIEDNTIPTSLSSVKEITHENEEDNDEDVIKNEKHSKVSSDELPMEEF